MTPTQQLSNVEFRLSEVRQQVNDFNNKEALAEGEVEQLEALTKEYRELEIRFRSLKATEVSSEERSQVDGEVSERRAIQEKVEVRAYVDAARLQGPVGGAESEFNSSLGMDAGKFPMSLLVGSEEHRAAIAGDAQESQMTWVDRLFAVSAAMRLGVTFVNVPAGKTDWPVTTAGATGAQRGNAQAATDAPYTISVTSLAPTRNTVFTKYSQEDAMRLPGLEDAIVRDLRMSVMDAVDKAIFVGDDGATPNAGDITGIQTATGVTEKTVTQANKLLPSGVLAAFSDFVDGKHATMMEDINCVFSVGANTLWTSTFPYTTGGNTTPISQILKMSDLSWMVRGELGTTTAANAFGAYVGLRRGISEAGVACVWDAGELIRDRYSAQESGEVGLSLSYYWNFGLPRASNFGRVNSLPSSTTHIAYCPICESPHTSFKALQRHVKAYHHRKLGGNYEAQPGGRTE